MSIFGIFLARIFRHLDWIQENRDHKNRKYGHFFDSKQSSILWDFLASATLKTNLYLYSTLKKYKVTLKCISAVKITKILGNLRRSFTFQSERNKIKWKKSKNCWLFATFSILKIDQECGHVAPNLSFIFKKQQTAFLKGFQSMLCFSCGMYFFVMFFHPCFSYEHHIFQLLF